MTQSAGLCTDALSRLSAPESAEVPQELLTLPRRSWPEPASLLRIQPPGCTDRDGTDADPTDPRWEAGRLR